MVEYKHKIYEAHGFEYIGCIGHFCDLGLVKLEDILKDKTKEVVRDE